MSTQSDASQLLERFEHLVGEAKLLLNDVQKVGPRSGMPMPDIGNDIAPTIELQALPFTAEELSEALAAGEEAIKTANRMEKSAQRITLVLQAATALIPKVAALL